VENHSSENFDNSRNSNFAFAILPGEIVLLWGEIPPYGVIRPPEGCPHEDQNVLLWIPSVLLILLSVKRLPVALKNRQKFAKN
jgi:hypothetical protein